MNDTALKPGQHLIACKCGRMAQWPDEKLCMLCKDERDRRQFPILEYQRAKGCPPTIPFVLVEPHARQADKNHGQKLARLAERGGLSPVELYWVMTNHGLTWLRQDQYDIIQVIAVDFINEKIEQFNQLNQGEKA